MRRLFPVVLALAAVGACSDFTSPRTRSVAAVRPPTLRMVDSFVAPAVATANTLVYFRFFGACPSDGVAHHYRQADSAIVFVVAHLPDAPARCESLLSPLPFPSLHDAAEHDQRFVLRRPDGSEQHRIVRTVRAPADTSSTPAGADSTRRRGPPREPVAPTR